jgi:hypothetical protein
MALAYKPVQVSLNGKIIDNWKYADKGILKLTVHGSGSAEEKTQKLIVKFNKKG